MNILTWIILGFVAGVGANLLFPESAKGGVISAVILGIVGAIVGGFISSILLGIDISGFNLTSIIIAVVGSLVLLFGWRVFRRSA